MKNIDIEKLMKEAKIIYFQQNHIGIPDKIEKLENIAGAPALQCKQEG